MATLKYSIDTQENIINYKINNTSVCLNKFSSFLEILFTKTAQIFCIRVEVFNVLLNFSSVTMLDSVNLLLENVMHSDWLVKIKVIVLNLTQIIRVNRCEYPPFKTFSRERLIASRIITDEKFNKTLKTSTRIQSV